MTKDFYPYAVFVRTPEFAEPDAGWGTAVWRGEANGHEDALREAAISSPTNGWAVIDVMTVCLGDEGFPPTMRQWTIARVTTAVG